MFKNPLFITDYQFESGNLPDLAETAVVNAEYVCVLLLFALILFD